MPLVARLCVRRAAAPVRKAGVCARREEHADNARGTLERGARQRGDARVVERVNRCARGEQRGGGRRVALRAWRAQSIGVRGRGLCKVSVYICALAFS